MDKKKKRQIILIILSIILTGATLVTTAFAWFVFVDVQHSVIFTTGTIKVDAVLYQANDLNYDGIFEESDYEEVTGPIVLDNIVSKQIFSFKLVVKNQGTIPGKVKITFKNLPTGLTINNVITLKYSDLDGSTYSNVETPFPTNDFIIGTKDSLNYTSGSNETVLLFQIEVTKNLTNAHYGQVLVIDHIEVELEQIPPLP